MPVISTNTAANTAVRYLNINSSEQSESLSKLASGSRIVNASDDAAGLAISTRIQSDVTALQQAATNASHGISVLQTADGGAANISDILQRMKALASESASGTVTDNERTYINAEFSQLIDEIEGTATSTRYNGQSLLDGTSAFADGISVMVGSDASDTIMIAIGSLTSDALGLSASVDTAAADLVGGAAGVTVESTTSAVDTAPASLTSTDTDGITIAAGETATFTVSDGTNDFVVTLGDSGSAAAQSFDAQDIADAITAAIGSTTTGLSASVTTGGALTLSNTTTGADSEITLSAFSTTDTAATFAAADLGFATTTSVGSDAGTTTTGTVSFDVNGTTVSLTSDGGANSDGVYTADDIADAINTALGAVSGNTVTASVDATSGALTLSNSATGATSTLEIDNFTGTGFTATSLGFSDTSSAGMAAGDTLSVTTQDGANAAIDALDAAINTVSKARADIGATSSRFEFRSETIATSTENLSAANSAITDVDIASEQAKLSSAEVKTKAAVAAAATANQMPQDLLKLMQ